MISEIDMELFKKDNSADEYYGYKKSRENFTKSNNKMTRTIKDRVIDDQNVNYSEVHTEIYKEIGLGVGWSIEKNMDAEEIDTATNGFDTVTHGLKNYKSKSIFSFGLIEKIKSFFE